MSIEATIWSASSVRSAEGRAIAGGVSAEMLMMRAGCASAQAIADRRPPGEALVVCGPGGNGGDGFVVARLLAERGWPMRVIAVGPTSTGAAQAARERWNRPVEALDAEFGRPVVVVDALFGIGLTRPLGAEFARLADEVAQARAKGAYVVALDLPSGVDSETGATLGVAVAADLTVAFHRLKVGHALLPGRSLCGEVVVADIGLDADEPALARLNRPTPEWRPVLNAEAGGHKYTRGHTLVIAGGAEGVGAARLAARAALRVGSGLVTLASPPDAFAAHAARGPDALIVRSTGGEGGLPALLEDRRRNAIVIGPALGHGREADAALAAAIGTGRRLAIDADALTAFAGRAAALGAMLRASGAEAVLTPHDGEFARLFEGVEAAGAGSKIARVAVAARAVGAVVVLKGADTVVAHPDGRAVVNDNAPPWLATAGSGDVLSGFVAGLLARGLAPFSAAALGVWLHGAAGTASGRGLIADDLPDAAPSALNALEIALAGR